MIEPVIVVDAVDEDDARQQWMDRNVIYKTVHAIVVTPSKS